MIQIFFPLNDPILLIIIFIKKVHNLLIEKQKSGKFIDQSLLRRIDSKVIVKSVISNTTVVGILIATEFLMSPCNSRYYYSVLSDSCDNPVLLSIFCLYEFISFVWAWEPFLFVLTVIITYLFTMSEWLHYLR